MKGKVKESDMSERITENLKIMDSLLEIRKVQITSIEATRSADALITYLNQNSCGRWVINNYAHLSGADKLVFIKGMNKVLPYIKNRDAFIERIKFSMKDNLCKTIDFDCYINDFMATSEDDCVLTDEGYDLIHKKYEKEVNEFLKELDEERHEYEVEQILTVNDAEELPFK